MIAKGSRDEDLARHHIHRLQGLLGHWNEAADTYRMAARGSEAAAPWLQREADRTRVTSMEAAELCDGLVDSLPPGHEMWGELLRLGTSLDALSESIAASAEAMGPRIERSRDIAGLKYLVGALRKDAGLEAVAS